MGTKWKNTKNNVRAFWLAHRAQILTGVLALLALTLFLLLAFNYRRMNTRIVWSFGLAMNLIGAAALMRPSKSVQDMELKSLKKKFKDKHFAAGCDREVIKQGAEMLGWELDELLGETLEAMKTCEEPAE